MNILISIIVAAICAALCWLALDQELSQKFRIFNSLSPTEEQGEYQSMQIGSTHLWCVVAIVGAVCAVAVYIMQGVVDAPLQITRLCITMACLVGAAAFDYREKRIPNIFPAALAACAIVCYGIGYTTALPGVKEQMVSSLISSFACILVLTVAGSLTKGGIGAGDIKLIAAMALMTGVYPLLGSLFYGSILCSIIAIILLITKKKDQKGGIPFAPFLFLGYIATIISGVI